MQQFIQLIQSRSDERQIALSRIADLPGSMMTILGQELDALLKVLYLLSIPDIEERRRLMACTVRGECWTVTTPQGETVVVTDAMMLDVSDQFRGWPRTIYKFGWVFLRLSHFYGSNATNPLSILSDKEKSRILDHLRQHLGGPQSDNPTLPELAQYCPVAFAKVRQNLECYLADLAEEIPSEYVL